MTRGLRNSGTLRRFKEKDNVNPMEGVANLADCMLVLACGLMLSLIISWNLDIAIDTPLDIQSASDKPQEMVDGIQESELDDPDAVSEFEEFGTLYRDPKTGEFYVIRNGEVS